MSLCNAYGQITNLIRRPCSDSAVCVSACVTIGKWCSHQHCLHNSTTESLTVHWKPQCIILTRIGSVAQIMSVSLLPWCMQDNHITNMCASISHRALRWRSQGWKSAALHHCLVPRERRIVDKFNLLTFCSILSQCNTTGLTVFFYAKRATEKKKGNLCCMNSNLQQTVKSDRADILTC